MTDSKPARAARRRTRSTALAVGIAGLVLILVATAPAAARSLRNGNHCTYLPAVSWPQREPAMRFPVLRQIVSMAGVTLPVAGTPTHFNPLIAEGYSGKTGSDSAAGGCLAFFTHVTVGGHRLTAAGVVMRQGQGSHSSVILAAVASRCYSLPPRSGSAPMSTQSLPAGEHT